MFKPKGVQCQSCGMPLSRDPQKGGTNADGTTSSEFCSYCYQNGKFVIDNVSVEEFQKRCVENMKKKGIPGFIARWFSKSIPNLKRWKN